jgi:hypothetical protein
MKSKHVTKSMMEWSVGHHKEYDGVSSVVCILMWILMFWFYFQIAFILVWILMFWFYFQIVCILVWTMMFWFYFQIVFILVWILMFWFYFQIVFIPVWIVMCTAMIGVLYAIILAIILVKSPDIVPQHRRGNVSSAVGYSFLVVPLLIFEVQVFLVWEMSL